MIHIENLWKKFRRHDALRGLSFAVEPGSALAFVGANGAGKTTTIKIMMNILEPTRGSVRILGVDSRRISPAELSQIGYVAESQRFPGAMTVSDYIDYLRPFYPSWDRDLESSLRQHLDLPPKRRIAELSHGMRMKMALTCSLSFRPKLLILDEPFSGLDAFVRDEIMEGLLGQAGEMTVLISSHELDEIAGMTTDVVFIEEGRLLFQESMGGLSERFREVRVTLDREATVPVANPNGWMNIQAMGSVLTFVDGHYTERDSGEKIRTQITGVRSIDTEAMSLRSIFTTLVRQARATRRAEGGAR